VLTGLLRGEMGFKGIIISDAMDMRGVLDQFGAAEAAKRAIAFAQSLPITAALAGLMSVSHLEQNLERPTVS
jgi:beta-glucosidase-like glycosyl hydrolase